MIVFPRSSLLIIYLRVFRVVHNFAWTLAEAAIYKLIKGEFSYDIVGADWLDQLGHASGAIVLTAHMGSYDLGAALFAEKFDREIRMVRAPEPDRQSARHLDASLERSGEGAVRVDYNTSGAMLSFDLLNALRQGEIVSIQGDRAEGDIARRTARLFDTPVEIPDGPFVLAQVANVQIYPLFITRLGYRSYRITVREPITVPRTGPERDKDIARAVEEWSVLLEQTICEHWDQWFAFSPAFLAHDKKA